MNDRTEVLPLGINPSPAFCILSIEDSSLRALEAKQITFSQFEKIKYECMVSYKKIYGEDECQTLKKI